MTSLSPRLLKGGIVVVDPETGRVLRVIALQYNPDTLTRTLQVQATGGERRRPVRGAAAQGRGGRDDQARGRDRRDRPARATRTRTRTRSRSASTRSSRRSRRSSSRAPTTCRRTTTLAGSGVLEVLPLEAPLTLFVWSKQRVVPVRVTDLSVTEEAFDVALNPIRAKVTPRPARALGRRPRLRPPRRDAVHGATCATRRRSPASAASGGPVATLGIGGDLMSRSAAGAARRRRGPVDDRSRRRAGTPGVAGRRRWDPGDGSPPVPFLGRRLLPARRTRSRCSTRCGVVEGDRRDVLAARHLGDAELWWRLADANGVVDPRELTDADRHVAADHAARGRPGDAAMAEPGPPPAPDRAPASRCPAPRGRARRRAARSRSSPARARRRAASSSRSGSRTARRCRRSSCSPAARASRSSASSIAVTLGGTTTVLMDGVMTHHEIRSDGGPTSTLVGQGQGPDGADGHHRRSTGCRTRRCRRRCACSSRSRSTRRSASSRS